MILENLELIKKEIDIYKKALEMRAKTIDLYFLIAYNEYIDG